MDGLVNIVNLQLDALVKFINGVFDYIFPEYPAVGVAAVLVAAFTFFVLMFFLNLGRAAKLSGIVLGGLVFIFILVHAAARILDLNI